MFTVHRARIWTGGFWEHTGQVPAVISARENSLGTTGLTSLAITGLGLNVTRILSKLTGPHVIRRDYSTWPNDC